MPRNTQRDRLPRSLVWHVLANWLPRPTALRSSTLKSAAIDAGCLAAALAGAIAFLHPDDWLAAGAPGLKKAIPVACAVAHAVAAWGFYRWLVGLALGESLACTHPGALAWWLTGGVWLTALAADQAIELNSAESAAVFRLTGLASILLFPFVLMLLLSCLVRRERARSNWRTWLGFAVGCTMPLASVAALGTRL